MKLRNWLLSLSAIAVTGLMSPATAHDDGGHLIRMWEITPKAGAAGDFKKGVQEHMAWRKANKDPWGWSLYTAESGNDSGSVYVRSSGHHWADFDAYRDSEFAKKAFEHLMKTVDPYVASYESAIEKTDGELFYWPEDGGNLRYFDVTTFYLKPGHTGPARQAVKAVSDELKAAGRKAPHIWIWAKTGKHLPALSVVSARDNWAGFDWPEKGAYDTLAERVGAEKAQAMFADFFEHVKSQQTQIYSKDLQASFDAAQ